MMETDRVKTGGTTRKLSFIMPRRVLLPGAVRPAHHSYRNLYYGRHAACLHYTRSVSGPPRSFVIARFSPFARSPHIDLFSTC